MQAIIDRSELGALDAVETTTRVRVGDLKATEVVAAAVERARTLGNELNAIPTEGYAAALARAEGLLEQGEIGVGDNIHVKKFEFTGFELILSRH